jgi:hypothetical protein
MEVLKMKKNTVWRSEYFCGNKISEYGLKNGYVDYRTFASSFDAVLNNNIINYRDNYEYWDIVNGYDYKEEYDEYIEVYQYYIISEQGYNILKDYTNELVYYNSDLDMYLWGVTHYGTSWNYVLTDIKIEVV